MSKKYPKVAVGDLPQVKSFRLAFCENLDCECDQIALIAMDEHDKPYCWIDMNASLLSFLAQKLIEMQDDKAAFIRNHKVYDVSRAH